MNGPDGFLLADGRPVEIRRIEITRTLQGILGGGGEEIWEHVIRGSSFAMGRGRGALPSAYVVPPGTTVSGRLVPPPEWRVAVALDSDGLAEDKGDTLGLDQEMADLDIKSRLIEEFNRCLESWENDYSSVVMVFLCEDVSSRPLTELIANQVARMDEKLWRQYAVVGHTGGYIQ